MSPRDRILEPYTRRVNDLPHRLRKTLAVSAILFLAVVVGFLTAILPQQFIVIPLLPLIALLLLVLWMAPDIDPELDRAFCFLFLLYTGAALVWPHYVAFVLPGVGYLTPPRLFLIPMFAVAIYFIATSSRARGMISDAFNVSAVAKWTFIFFIAAQAAITIATNTVNSRWLLGLVIWYFMTVAAVIVFSYEGTVRRFFGLILSGVIVVCIAAFAEWTQSYKFWMDWFPPWLQGDPELWNKVLQGSGRAGTGSYRASGILLTPVTVGEFIAFTAPFTVWYMITAKTVRERVTGILVIIALALGTWGSNSRTTFVGLIVGLGVFSFLWSIRRHRRSGRTRDLVGPAAVWAFPIMALLTLLSVLFVGRIRRLVLGGGEHQASNDARKIQWEKTFDLLERNPIGYGSGRSPELIGYMNPGRDTYTVDGYYMTLLVDYGILPFLAFVIFFFACAWVAARTYLRAETPDEDASVAVASALAVFLVTKLVSAQTEVNYIMFPVAAMALALAARQQRRLRTAAPPPARQTHRGGIGVVPRPALGLPGMR